MREVVKLLRRHWLALVVVAFLGSAVFFSLIALLVLIIDLLDYPGPKLPLGGLAAILVVAAASALVLWWLAGKV